MRKSLFFSHWSADKFSLKIYLTGIKKNCVVGSRGYTPPIGARLVLSDTIPSCLVGPFFLSGRRWAPSVLTFRYLGYFVPPFSAFLTPQFPLLSSRISFSRLRRGPRWVSSGPRGQQRFEVGRDLPVQRSGNWPGPQEII